MQFVCLTLDTVSVVALEKALNIVARMTHRGFVGLPLCNEPPFR